MGSCPEIVMGKALFYCFKCSRLLREDDLEKGRAFRIGDRVACEDCAGAIPGAIHARPAVTPPAIHRPRSSSQRVPVSPATPRAPLPPPPPRRSVLPYVILGAVALLLIIVVAVATSGRSRGAPPPPVESPDRR